MKRSSCASGSGIGALLLDRVLGREHQERQRQVVGLSARRHAVLLHRLQQRRLGLGRRPVDLVGENHVGEDRPAHEAEDAPAGGAVLLEHVGAGDVRRHQVGRELDAPERQVEHVGQRLDQQRLRQAGHADEQAVAAREQRDQQVIDHRVLPDDALADLGGDRAPRLRHLAHRLEIAIGIGDGRGRRGVAGGRATRRGARERRIAVGHRGPECHAPAPVAMTTVGWLKMGRRKARPGGARREPARVEIVALEIPG